MTLNTGSPVPSRNAAVQSQVGPASASPTLPPAVAAAPAHLVGPTTPSNPPATTTGTPNTPSKKRQRDASPPPSSLCTPERPHAGPSASTGLTSLTKRIKLTTGFKMPQQGKINFLASIASAAKSQSNADRTDSSGSGSAPGEVANPVPSTIHVAASIERDGGSGEEMMKMEIQVEIQGDAAAPIVESEETKRVGQFAEAPKTPISADSAASLVDPAAQVTDGDQIEGAVEEQVTPAQAATATAPETCGGSNYFASQPNDTDQAGLLAVEPVGQVNNGLVAAADTAANATPAEVPQQDSANLVQVEYGRILVFPRAGVLVADGADAARGVRIAGENIDTVDASGNDWRAKQLGDFIRNLPDNIKRLFLSIIFKNQTPQQVSDALRAMATAAMTQSQLKALSLANNTLGDSETVLDLVRYHPNMNELDLLGTGIGDCSKLAHALTDARLQRRKFMHKLQLARNYLQPETVGTMADEIQLQPYLDAFGISRFDLISLLLMLKAIKGKEPLADLMIEDPHQTPSGVEGAELVLEVLLSLPNLVNLNTTDWQLSKDQMVVILGGVVEKPWKFLRTWDMSGNDLDAEGIELMGESAKKMFLLEVIVIDAQKGSAEREALARVRRDLAAVKHGVQVREVTDGIEEWLAELDDASAEDLEYV